MNYTPFDELKTINSRFLAVKETSLIDRAIELESLKESVDRAINGQGGLVLLRGEPGIGKTRLIKELQTYASLRGMQVLNGRGSSLLNINPPPYVIWTEIIRDYLQNCTPEQLHHVVGYYPGEIFKLVPEIKRKLIVFSESPSLSPDMERERLFEAVSQFIINIAKQTPLLAILDDLHWADPSSLSLLQYVTRGIGREKLLFVGAYRDSEVKEEHPLTASVMELNRTRLLQSIPLRRFSQDEVAETIEQQLGCLDVPVAFRELVYRKTGGNPFFIEEVIKSLKEENVITLEENALKIKDVSEIALPESVKDVLKTRLKRLSDDCLEVIKSASFIGNEFTFEELLALTQIDEGKLLEMVEKMLKAGLLKCGTIRGKDALSFIDVLVRDFLVEEVSPIRRKKFHGLVALTLERIYKDGAEEHYNEIASHFLESGNDDKALDYFLKAGAHATKIYANREATMFNGYALSILEKREGNDEEKARIKDELGDIKNLIGDYDDCLKLWDEAALYWQRLNQSERLAQSYRKMAHVLWMTKGEHEKAQYLLAKAMDSLKANSESSELANCRLEMADISWHSGDSDKANLLASEALETAWRLGTKETVARSLCLLGKISNFAVDHKKAFEYYMKALEIALGEGFISTAVDAYNGLARAVLDTESAMENFEKGYELARKAGVISAQSWIGSHLSREYLFRGNVEKAFLIAEESVEFDRKTGNLHNLSMSLNALGNAYRRNGEFSEAERCHEEALTIARNLDHIPQVAWTYICLAQLFLDMENYAKVKDVSEKLLEINRKGETDFPADFATEALFPYVAASIELEEFVRAEQLINMLQKIRERTPSSAGSSASATVDDLKASLLRAQQKWKEAIEYFEKRIQEQGSRPHQRLTMFFARFVLFECARTYLERDQEGDRLRAVELLNQALDVFHKMKAKYYLEKTKAQIDYAQTGRKMTKEPAITARTGYATLDKLLNGGIQSTAAIALTSPPCDEKDSLIRSYLETGVKGGDATFYVTINQGIGIFLAQEYPSRFILLICNPQAEAIVRPSANILILKGIENLTNINIALTQAIRKLDPSIQNKRICLDVISDILLQHHSVQTRKWLLELITQLKVAGFTTLAVMNPQMHPSEEMSAVLSLFDGEITIEEAETEQGTARFLRVKRMSNQRFSREKTCLTE